MPIPLLGQTIRTLTWYPTALAACQCSPGKMNLLVLVGFHEPKQCPDCKKMYAIRGITAEGADVQQMTELALPSS